MSSLIRGCAQRESAQSAKGFGYFGGAISLGRVHIYARGALYAYNIECARKREWENEKRGIFRGIRALYFSIVRFFDSARIPPFIIACARGRPMMMIIMKPRTRRGPGFVNAFETWGKCVRDRIFNYSF